MKRNDENDLVGQRGEILRARVLEIWRGREQVFQARHWSNLCNFEGSSGLHFNQRVSSSSALHVSSGTWI